MAADYLFDTNIVTALPTDPSLSARLQPDDTVSLASVVLGELYFAAFNSGRVQRNLESVTRLLDRFVVLQPDEETAREFGRLKQQLRAKGRPIPDHDGWIAATGIQHDLTLVTRDAHFDAIDGLRLEHW